MRPVAERVAAFILRPLDRSYDRVIRDHELMRYVVDFSSKLVQPRPPADRVEPA